MYVPHTLYLQTCWTKQTTPLLSKIRKAQRRAQSRLARLANEKGRRINRPKLQHLLEARHTCSVYTHRMLHIIFHISRFIRSRIFVILAESCNPKWPSRMSLRSILVITDGSQSFSTLMACKPATPKDKRVEISVWRRAMIASTQSFDLGCGRRWRSQPYSRNNTAFDAHE